MKTVLYYQINPLAFKEVVKEWETQARQLAYERNDLSVSVINADYAPFKGDEGELLFYLKRYSEDYSNLYVVIGKINFNEKTRELPSFLAEVLLSVISYPEVSFFFEDKTILESIEQQYPKECEQPKSILIKELLCPFSDQTNLANSDINDIISITNWYDASNLRSFVRSIKLSQLSLQDSFQNKHNWKENNLAFTIDEEFEQSLLNGFILYQNGYRCLPISTLRSLRKFYSSSGSGNVKYSLLLRDFDLQFPDEKIESGDFPNVDSVSAVDYIRGFKLTESDGSYSWKELIEDGGIIWTHSDYYSTTPKVLFVIQDYKHLTPALNVNQPVVDGELKLPGMKKPVSGIYYAIKRFKRINESYNKSHSDFKAIERQREERNHNAPLDLYSIAISIVDRAERYYRNNQHIIAAILSEDAIELLNGQHLSLSLRAYHLLAVAENAIAMNIIGGDEYTLMKDAEERVDKITKEIERLMGGTGQESLNVLNQIFSDCRHYCKTTEHFQAEDVFISAMAHLNEGYSIFKPNTWHSLQRMKK